MMFIQEINLPKRKDGAYVINLDEFKSIKTHLIVLYVNGNNSEILEMNIFQKKLKFFWKH